MNDREKNALLLRELKTAVNWHELADNTKQLVTEYRDKVINKLKNFLTLNQEEKEILHKLPDEVLTQIKENIPPQLQEILEQDITPTVEDVREPSEEKRKEKETEELKRREELAKVSPEAAVLLNLAPELYNSEEFFNEYEGLDGQDASGYVDASISAFVYLRTMGITSGMWEIGPEHFNCIDEKGRDCCRPHKGVDPNTPICQALWPTTFSLDDIINRAYSYMGEHGLQVPKAIIALSHPFCACHISCWIPTSAEEIPDSAPGLPTFADPEELLYYKEQALAKMTSFAQDGVSIPVDRWTVLSPDIYENTAKPKEKSLQDYNIDWRKPNAFQAYIRHIRAAENWIEDIKPVIVREGFIYEHTGGLVRPVPDTYFGIQIERNDKERRVFLSNMSYIIKVPDRNVEEVKIKPVSSAKPEPHDYIKVDDTYGIIITVLSDGRLYCYLPEFNEKIFVDNGTLYEIA